MKKLYILILVFFMGGCEIEKTCTMQYETFTNELEHIIKIKEVEDNQLYIKFIDDDGVVVEKYINKPKNLVSWECKIT